MPIKSRIDKLWYIHSILLNGSKKEWTKAIHNMHESHRQVKSKRPDPKDDVVYKQWNMTEP